MDTYQHVEERDARLHANIKPHQVTLDVSVLLQLTQPHLTMPCIFLVPII